MNSGTVVPADGAAGPVSPGPVEATEAAALARTCRIMAAARKLAASIGPQGVRVTPTGALAPAEVPAAARSLGLRAKPPIRRAADVPAVHRGWLTAVAAGLVRVTSGRAIATAAPDPDGPPSADEAVLAGWLEGLRLICADLSGRQRPDTVQWLVLLTLDYIVDEDLIDEIDDDEADPPCG